MTTAVAKSAVAPARREWAGFAGVSVAVVLFYFVYRAPVMNPGTDLDPWIYTGSMVNYHFIESVFGRTYYPARLPWILPGIVIHAFFGPVLSFFVLHALFFFGAGVFAYLTARHFWGVPAALTVYAALMLSPLFYDAYSNDYPDGALLTYLFGSVYFALTVPGARRPRLRMFWTGFFVAAAVGVNLFAGIVIASLLIVYGFVRSDVRRRQALGLELGVGAAGAVALLVICGTFSKAEGGEFLFFMPQVRELSTLSPSSYKKTHGLAFVLAEPQFALPVFAAACVLVLLIRWRRDRITSAGRHLAIGTAVATLLLYLVLAVWEVAKSGVFFETPYYFSLFSLYIALCLGAAIGLLRPAALAAPVAIAAAVASTVLTLWVSVLPVGRRGALIAVCLMAVTLGVLAAWRLRPHRTSTVLALVALIVFTSTYSADAGTITAGLFVRGTFNERRAVQADAFQLIEFMRARGIQKMPFEFWYTTRDGDYLDGIQSTYLWGDSMVGHDLPRVDAAMKALLEERKPSALVLLCRTASCHGAIPALRRAGYSSRPLTTAVLSSGGIRVVVRVVLLPRFVAYHRNPSAAYYQPNASPLAATATGRAVASWSFAGSVPAGWTGDAAAAAGAARGGAFETSTPQWAYELVGPRVELQPGRYAVYASGRVLSGGLDLGVLDAGRRAWIEQRVYWYGQHAQFANAWMETPFTVPTTTSIQVILSNWVPKSQPSRWQLGEVRVVRLPQ